MPFEKNLWFVYTKIEASFSLKYHNVKRVQTKLEKSDWGKLFYIKNTYHSGEKKAGIAIQKMENS